MELSSSYDPKLVEDKWYQIWEEEGLFHALEDDELESFSIVIPPPNVTGSLHLGHALNNTLQDIIIRWQRMQRKSTLWMPGMDHAGIATQNVVERLLHQEQKTKHKIGRDAFVKRVWEWKEHSGGQIKEQLKRLGASLDWERERFTLDEGLSKAVRRVFVTLYNEDLIYQGYRIINWCPRCGTALSDIETEYHEIQGKLYYIAYPLVDTNETIDIATTRPETMLGDTGIAVNPGDNRYKHLIGKNVLLPLMNREIPIFADSYVDKEFGTGLVKVTPAHDPNDFEMGQRHGLEEINILDKNGDINDNGGQYSGLSRFEARDRIVEDLRKEGQLVKIEDYNHSVGHCYRCHTVIEPYLSKQWFVKIKPIAKEAIRAVEDGRIRFVPQNWEKTYFEWMHNIRDWCISRQLWWGHRIPAFYCSSCENIIVSMEDPEKCDKCGSMDIYQDEDVLDTWFSSALWPFSTLGWPEITPALEKYYPTNVLVTSFDIIFFWVARMIMMGLKFMGDVPFHDVYIHALIRDEHGNKMSKSKGNVIDPIIMMDKYGTDALRFTLAVLAAQGRDIILSEKRIEGYSAFCNKIWNATRFILINLGEGFKPEGIDVGTLNNFDKWILHRLNIVIDNITTAFAEYKFNEAAQTIYEFWWHEFCDWYIELTKSRLYSEDNTQIDSVNAAKQVLYHVLTNSIILLHPFMPYITEEIWSKISNSSKKRIAISDWPEINEEYNFHKASEETDIFKEIVYKIRNIRGEMNIPPDRRATVIFKTKSQGLISLIKRDQINLKALAKVEEIIIKEDYNPERTDAIAVLHNAELFIPLKELIDIERERARIEKEIIKITSNLDKMGKKLSNNNFLQKAPENIILKEKKKMEESESLLSKLKESLAKLP
ncbi:MAG: valine--tRNA ligase [Spirochaetota bacterium]|nr:valine--tRNA ligase [Spirochaetota bacterium]